ncbi:hypothetical protein FB451DRAFT_1554183 [Mycena latifolia]|nr:hypothetical protein FB451DRAFT_1554183 [Mycena latifolia]
MTLSFSPPPVSCDATSTGSAWHLAFPCTLSTLDLFCSCTADVNPSLPPPLWSLDWRSLTDDEPTSRYTMTPRCGHSILPPLFINARLESSRAPWAQRVDIPAAMMRGVFGARDALLRSPLRGVFTVPRAGASRVRSVESLCDLASRTSICSTSAYPAVLSDAPGACIRLPHNAAATPVAWTFCTRLARPDELALRYLRLYLRPPERTR